MPLSPSDLHVNQLLTNISVAYIQRRDDFVADRVFPIIPVQKQSDRYLVYVKGDWFRAEARERAPATESAGAYFRVDNTPTYAATVHAVHMDIDDMLRANADDPLDLDRDATQWVTQQLLLRREKVWASRYFTAGVWGTDLTGVSAAPAAGQFLQWDQANSTPIDIITDQIVAVTERTGYRPNVLVLGPRVYNALRNHPQILDRVKYTQRATVTADLLASLLDVERVLIAWATENTAPEGAADNFQYVFGKHALLVYAAPNPSILQPSGGYIFAWTGYAGATAYGTRIKRFRMEHLAADRIEGEIAFDAKLVAADLGVFFQNAVA